MAFEEWTLRYSTVLYFGFCDKDGLIGQVVIDFDLSDSVVFESAFNNMLLEICIESENFSIVFDPGRLNPGDRVILRSSPFILEAHVIDALGKFVDEIDIDILGHILSLFLLTVIRKHKLLCFVIVLLVRIVEDVPWEEGHLLWYVGLHWKCQLYIYYDRQ